MKNSYTSEDAKKFAEGNKTLEEILLLCLEKDIITNACCAGHYERLGKGGCPYISFLMNGDMEQFANAFFIHEIKNHALIRYNINYVDYPDLKKESFSLRLKKKEWESEQEFLADVQEFFAQVKAFIQTFQPQKETASQISLYNELKKKYCRFQLDFVGDVVTEMFIQTPTITPIEGYEAEQKGILVSYKKINKIPLNQICEELMK